MSRTDNTRPYRLRADTPFRYARRWTSSSELQFRRRRHNRRDRHDARADLHQGREPAPRQGRHRALWDAF